MRDQNKKKKNTMKKNTKKEDALTTNDLPQKLEKNIFKKLNLVVNNTNAILPKRRRYQRQ
jgi:hypothetical protein